MHPRGAPTGTPRGCHPWDTPEGHPREPPMGCTCRSSLRVPPAGWDCAALVFRLCGFGLNFQGTDTPDLNFSVIGCGPDLIRPVTPRYIKERAESRREKKNAPTGCTRGSTPPVPPVGASRRLHPREHPAGATHGMHPRIPLTGWGCAAFVF